MKARLKSELSGDFRQAVLYSFYDKAHVNARACYKAMKGAGTDEKILVDVICTSDNDEIAALKEAYMDSKELTLPRKHNCYFNSRNFLSFLVLAAEKQNSESID